MALPSSLQKVDDGSALMFPQPQDPFTCNFITLTDQGSPAKLSSATLQVDKSGTTTVATVKLTVPDQAEPDIVFNTQLPVADEILGFSLVRTFDNLGKDTIYLVLNAIENGVKIGVLFAFTRVSGNWSQGYGFVLLDKTGYPIHYPKITIDNCRVSGGNLISSGTLQVVLSGISMREEGGYYVMICDTWNGDESAPAFKKVAYSDLPIPSEYENTPLTDTGISKTNKFCLVLAGIPQEHVFLVNENIWEPSYIYELDPNDVFDIYYYGGVTTPRTIDPTTAFHDQPNELGTLFSLTFNGNFETEIPTDGTVVEYNANLNMVQQGILFETQVVAVPPIAASDYGAWANLAISIPTAGVDAIRQTAIDFINAGNDEGIVYTVTHLLDQEDGTTPRVTFTDEVAAWLIDENHFEPNNFRVATKPFFAFESDAGVISAGIPITNVKIFNVSGETVAEYNIRVNTNLQLDIDVPNPTSVGAAMDSNFIDENFTGSASIGMAFYRGYVNDAYSFVGTIISNTGDVVNMAASKAITINNGSLSEDLSLSHSNASQSRVALEMVDGRITFTVENYENNVELWAIISLAADHDISSLPVPVMNGAVVEGYSTTRIDHKYYVKNIIVRYRYS